MSKSYRSTSPSARTVQARRSPTEDSASSGSRSGSLRYMGGLDGLRVIAVAAVILYHLNERWASGGLLGVGIFFVLSGYLITDILVSGWKRTGTVKLGVFWLRRARRLLPAMLTVVAAALVWTAVTGLRIPSLSGDALASLFYVNNWRLIFHQVSYFESFGTPSPLGHLWSLAVEEQFYVIWPLILLVALRLSPKRGRLIGLTLVLALLSALLMKLLVVPGLDPSRVYYGTDTRAFGLLIGAALAVIRPSGSLGAKPLRPRKRLLLEASGALSLAGIVWMIFHTDQYSASLYPGGLLLLSVLTAVLIGTVAHPMSGLGALLGCRPLRWLGKRSYGIYLWHYPIIVLTSPAVHTEGTGLLRSLLQVAATLIAAALSYRYIEEPIRHGALARLRKSLASRGGRKLALRQAGYLALGFSLFFGCASQLVPGALASGSASPGPDASAPASSPAPATPTGGQRPDSPPPSVTPGRPTPTASAADGTAVSAKPSPGRTTAPSPSLAPSAAGGKPSAGHSAPPAVPGSGAGKPVTPKPSPSAVPEHPSPSASPDSSEMPAPTPGIGTGTTAIGDSVMLDAEPFLKKLVPGIAVDGKIGRQMWDAQDIVDSLKASGKLGNRVIFNLGTNGAFTKKQLVKLLDSLQDAEQVIFVNVRVPRPWEASVNSMLAGVVRDYPNAKVVDWYAASAGHDDYFAPDGVHLESGGAEAYAKLAIKGLDSE